MTAIRTAASAAVPSEMSTESSHPFATARLITQGLRLWLEKRSRPEQIENALRSGAAPLPSSVRSVLLTAVREHGRIEFLLGRRVRKPPPVEIRAALHAALAEILLRRESSPAPIVHHWVDWVRGTRSHPESRFTNAVLRGCLRGVALSQPSRFLGPSLARANPEGGPRYPPGLESADTPGVPPLARHGGSAPGSTHPHALPGLF